MKSGGLTEFIFAWNIFMFSVPIVSIQDSTFRSLPSMPDYIKTSNVHTL